jgi:peptidoglycan/LPS O-acetylase OafA/YrhL
LPEEGIFSNYFLEIKNSLYMGVDFFFVLSSFLLTYLALNEHAYRNNFSFKRFMMRRVLRIWPLYFLMVITGFALLPLAASLMNISITLPSALYYLFFASNFYTSPHVFFLMFLWSIAVEEQLYLLFAFVYKFLITHLKKICAALFAIYLIYLWMAFDYHWSIFTNTINYLPNFSTGALLALFFYKRKNDDGKIFRHKKGMLILIYTASILLIVIFNNFSSGFFSQLTTKLLMCFFFAFAIADQIAFKNSPVKLERFAVLSWLGKRTYGLYCFHGIVFTLYTLVPDHFKHGFMNQLIACFSAMVLTLLMAIISYRFFESKFLKLKKNFYPGPSITL